MDDNPQPSMPHSPYVKIGSEAGVRKLTDRFYDLMDQNTEAKLIRDMHPQNLQDSRQKLFEFLSGFLGGPSLYMQNRGHPRLRMRHHSFKINTDARDNWLKCMNQALAEQIDDPVLLMQLQANFYRTADHLINTD